MPSIPAFVQDPAFYALCQGLDQDLADQAHTEGCPVCKGRLDQSHFPRKPRGLPSSCQQYVDERYSLCCARTGCRKRVTPASVRFLGRKVYVAAIVVLVTAMRHGVTRWRQAFLKQVLGVSAETLRRWRVFWQEAFAESDFWKGARGRLMPPVDPVRLPASLLERFEGDQKEQVLLLLRFIQPLLTGSVRKEQAR
jgi:hypothetical protein